MKTISQTDKLTVIELDKSTGADLIKKSVRLYGNWIPTHVLVYNDRVELRIQELHTGKKKIKKFSYGDLVVMNWALNRIGVKGKE